MLRGVRERQKREDTHTHTRTHHARVVQKCVEHATTCGLLRQNTISLSLSPSFRSVAEGHFSQLDIPLSSLSLTQSTFAGQSLSPFRHLHTTTSIGGRSVGLPLYPSGAEIDSDLNVVREGELTVMDKTGA